MKGDQATQSICPAGIIGLVAYAHGAFYLQEDKMDIAAAAARNDDELLSEYWWSKREPYTVDLAGCQQPELKTWTTAIVDARAPLAIGHGLVMLRGNNRTVFVKLRSEQEFNTVKSLIAFGDLHAAHRVLAFENRSPDGQVTTRTDAEQAAEHMGQ